MMEEDYMHILASCYKEENIDKLAYFLVKDTKQRKLYTVNSPAELILKIKESGHSNILVENNNGKKTTHNQESINFLFDFMFSFVEKYEKGIEDLSEITDAFKYVDAMINYNEFSIAEKTLDNIIESIILKFPENLKDLGEAYLKLVDCCFKSKKYDNTTRIIPIEEILDEKYNLIIGDDEFIQNKGAEIYTKIGVCMLDCNEYEDAVKAFTKAYELNKDPMTIILKANAMMDKAVYDMINGLKDSKKGIEKALNIYKNIEIPNMIKGDIYIRAGTCCNILDDNHKAIKYLKKAYKVDKIKYSFLKPVIEML